MQQNLIRQIVYYKHYYLDFFNSLLPEVQKKFNWTLQLISTVEWIPQKYFRHIEGTDGIYEIRVEVGSNIFRCFAFFEKDRLIVVANGFQKKSQKTPKSEIELAQKIKKQYFHEKNKK
ncbi:MAG: type II toxin-antitoxin system RelE/ParE family toxin [Agriterribacter sp.]